MNVIIENVKKLILLSLVAKWFNPEHETVVLPMVPTHDDDPLYDDPDYSPSSVKRISLPSCRNYDSFPYDLKYIACIGQSGWNYVKGIVTYVCIEFDSTDGHESGHGQDELTLIKDALARIPCCEVVTSTGGCGLHVRVRLANPVPATERSQYTQTIKHVLSLLDKLHELPFKLAEKVDKKALGRGVLWQWSNRMNEDSFRLLSEATESLDLGDWQPTIQEAIARAASDQEIICFDLEGFLRRNNISFTLKEDSRSKHVDGGKLYFVDCPFNKHSDKEGRTAVFLKNGVPCFNCYADKCCHFSWKHYAKQVAPNDQMAKINAATFAVLQVLYRSTLQDELFHDHDGNCYAVVNGQTMPIDSELYKLTIRLRYRESSGLSISDTHLKQAVAELVSFTRLKCPKYRTFLRTARIDDKFYLDLLDQVVEIDKSGWRVVEAPQGVRFIRPEKFLPLPTPERDGNPNLLWKYIPVAEDDRPLVLSWAISAMRSDILCPLLFLFGTAGNGKSSYAQFLGSLINPVTGEENKDFCLVTEPKKTEDLFAIAKNTWIPAIDNLSKIEKDTSDALCCLVTGTAYERRKFYTNFDESRATLRRPIIVTSVSNIIDESDLADRCYAIEVPTLVTRTPESELWEAFLKDRPKILGCLLDAFVAGLNNQQPVEGVRLLDCAIFSQAAEEVFHFIPGQTVDAIKKAQKRISETALQDSPLAKAIKDAIATESFEGTATEIMELVGDRISPCTARKFSTELSKVVPDLQKTGVRVGRRTLSGRTVWTFEKLSKA